jgi:sialate O-acetylesterase
MIMKTILTFFITVSLIFTLQAENKPKLERGKTYIDVPAKGEGLSVSNLFQSGMVLQRNKPLSIWGWADAGEKVSVTLSGKEQSVTAGEDRSWKVTFEPLEANSEGQKVLIKGKDKTLTLEDILIGDIWVLGGQSNMEFEIAKLVDGQLEIVSANFPKIRHITIPQLDGPELKKDFPRHYKWSSWSNRHFKQGYWETCTPETVRLLSGMGYVFARRIHMATQVPIGVVDVSRGGTTVETWAPLSELEKIDAEETQELLGNWKEKVEAFDPQKDLEERIKRHKGWVAKMKKAGKTANRPEPAELLKGPIVDQNKPGNCYASIISPLSGFAVKGAIFHQGFNNCFWGDKGPKMYYQVFGSMITSWRKAFGDEQLPFGIISLCTAGDPQDLDDYVQRMQDVGAAIREAQYKTFLDFKKAGDKTIGFASSFDQRRSWYHPQIKIPVGERIAKWALATQYGHRLTWEPATYTEVVAEEGKLLVKMNGIAMPHNDGPIHGFAIAGEDKKFQPANAEFLTTGKDNRGRAKQDRKVIILSHPMVPKPVHFRHAWSRNPMTNMKTNGIPLATQRSDNWTQADLYEAYIGKKTKVTGELDRGERRALSQAMKMADIERRVIEAKAFIAEQEEKDDKK